MNSEHFFLDVTHHCDSGGQGNLRRQDTSPVSVLSGGVASMFHGCDKALHKGVMVTELLQG